MKILLIEDEAQAAWNLKETILGIDSSIQILDTIESVSGVQNWFKNNSTPDLIFSDIQLGDGVVFDAFKEIEINCPIIFCTAFDEYLLQAFKNNGIDYLLKPINELEVKRSLDKYEALKKILSEDNHNVILNKAIQEILEKKSNYKTNFLLHHRDKLIPVSAEQIAFFKVNDSSTEIALLNGKTYQHNFTLDYLTKTLDPIHFYRVSRQFIISFQAILEIEHHDDRKLLIHVKNYTNEKIIISKAKASEFLQWVENR